MKKETWKWIAAVVLVIVVGVVVLNQCGRDNGPMKAVSENGNWEAYVMETTDGGEKAWRGVVVYKGEHPEEIKNVRTQRCVNGIKKKFTKRELKDAGTLGVKKSDAGGQDQFYIFMTGDKERPASVSVKVKWKEAGANHVEKMWLIAE